MMRFISTGGVDQVPLDVRFWGSALTLTDALTLKDRVDAELKSDPRTYAGLTTYVARTFVRNNFRQRQKLFEEGAELVYCTLYLEDLEEDGQSQSLVAREGTYERYLKKMDGQTRRISPTEVVSPKDCQPVSFDIFTAPAPPAVESTDPSVPSSRPIRNWHAICDTVTAILRDFSCGPPGGQV